MAVPGESAWRAAQKGLLQIASSVQVHRTMFVGVILLAGAAPSVW
jgi:hypothetical protein